MTLQHFIQTRYPELKDKFDYAKLNIYDLQDVLEAYAEVYAKKCLEEAARSATVNLPTHYALHGTKNVDRKSILNINLPTHD